MKKILNIVETPYRGTLEEQDDTVLWLTHALKNAGSSPAVLLRANAVNYGVRGQDPSGLTFGELTLAHPPQIDQDLEKMIGKGIQVYLVEEDARDRGISDKELIAGIEKIKRSRIPELMDQFDQIWHW